MAIQYTLGVNLWLDIFSTEIQKIKGDLIDFAKEELWLLFPLLAFMYHVKDQFTFYAPRRYLNYNSKKSLKYHTLSTLIIVLLVSLGLYVWTRIDIGEITVLFGFVISKLAHDLILIKWLDKKSLNS